MRRTYVYFIQNSFGQVKIGHSTDPVTRLSDLRVGTTDDLQIIRVLDGGRATERWLHRRFAPYRLTGEWFAWHDDMRTIVPPDENSKRRQEKPQLRLTLRESLRLYEATGWAEPGQERLLATLLVGAMWDDDLADFLQWVRERAGR